MNLALLADPGKPAFLVYRKETVQVDPGRNVGSILVLIFQTFFHDSQMNQVQHTAPVHGMLNALNVQLKLVQDRIEQMQLVEKTLKDTAQGIEHKMAVRVFDSHLPDILQGKSKIFQQQDLLQPCKVRVSIKSCAGLGYKRRFQNIVLVVIADGPQCYSSHPGKLTGRVVAVFFLLFLTFYCGKRLTELPVSRFIFGPADLD